MKIKKVISLLFFFSLGYSQGTLKFSTKIDTYHGSFYTDITAFEPAKEGDHGIVEFNTNRKPSGVSKVYITAIWYKDYHSRDDENVPKNLIEPKNENAKIEVPFPVGEYTMEFYLYYELTSGVSFTSNSIGSLLVIPGISTPLVSFTTRIKKPICKGRLGNIDIIPSGGITKNYKYRYKSNNTSVWSNWSQESSSSPFNIGNLYAGTYNIEVGQGTLPTSVKNVTIEDPSEVIFEWIPNYPITNVEKGSIVLKPSGGSENNDWEYSYKLSASSTWSQWTKGIHITNLSIGMYNVKVRDENGCESKEQEIEIKLDKGLKIPTVKKILIEAKSKEEVQFKLEINNSLNIINKGRIIVLDENDREVNTIPEEYEILRKVDNIVEGTFTNLAYMKKYKLLVEADYYEDGEAKTGILEDSPFGFIIDLDFFKAFLIRESQGNEVLDFDIDYKRYILNLKIFNNRGNLLQEILDYKGDNIKLPHGLSYYVLVLKDRSTGGVIVSGQSYIEKIK